MTANKPGDPTTLNRLYGRSLGKPLRAGQQALVDDLLPQISVPLEGEVSSTTLFGDSACAFNPIGDLYKSQVRQLAVAIGVPDAIIRKAPSADLWPGQTDEGDFGISYARADVILNWLLSGYSPAELAERGYAPAEVELVRRRLEGTHWKRKLPTVAMLSPHAIGESYLRPVDY